MNDLPIPLSRVDLYLAVAAGMEGVTLPEKPLSRLEQFLAVIAGDTTVELPIPGSLTELWLNYVAGGALTSEMELEGAYWVGAQKVDVRFFAIAGGMEGVTAPEPQNRTEEYWARIAEIKPIHGVLKYAIGTNITLTDVVSGITSLENVYGDTFQQTYSGKNLYNSPDRSQTRYDVTAAIANNRVTINGTAIRNNFGGTYFNLNGTDNANANYYNYDNTTSGITLAAGTYTLSLNNVTGSYTTPSLVQMFVCAVYSGSYPISTLATITLTNDQTSATFTIAEQTTVKIQFRVQVSTDTSVAVPVFNNYSFDLQLESGSTATTYEPYVGGTASPNPDYPQAIQVVTGTQTVTISDGINSQDYTVNLGSLELAKIGTYQDYIYKSGGDWYVHKEFGKIILNGSEGYVRPFRDKTNTYVVGITDGTADAKWTSSGYVNNMKSPNFISYSFNYLYDLNNDVEGMCLDTKNLFPTAPFCIALLKSRLSEVSFNGVKAWLASHNTTIYYQLNTPTDTQITDTTLISQLDAISNAVLPKPNANIEVTAAGTNLPGALEISYYGEEE